MRFREVEKIILADGWQFKTAKGSHCQYTHPTKPGKVTIPNHHNRQANLQTGRAVKPGTAIL